MDETDNLWRFQLTHGSRPLMMPESGLSRFDIWPDRIIAIDAVDAYCTKGQHAGPM
jgi:hypothetical protein